MACGGLNPCPSRVAAMAWLYTTAMGDGDASMACRWTQCVSGRQVIFMMMSRYNRGYRQGK